MLQNCELVSWDFLLDLQNMEVLGHSLNLSSAHGINKTCLTNTVSSNESVLSASRESKDCAVKQSFTSNDECHTWREEVSLRVSSLIMNDFRWWNSFLGCDEFVNLSVESVFVFLLLLLLLLVLLLDPSLLVFVSVIVSLQVSSLILEKWVHVVDFVEDT